MNSVFPNITYYLSEQSSCTVAQKVNGGRNAAQVLLDVYNAIPIELIDLRAEYCTEVSILLSDCNYIAPEIFPKLVWGNISNLMLKLFSVYINEKWAIRCADIYSNRIRPENKE